MAMLTSVQLGTEFDLLSTKPILSSVMADGNVSAVERAMVYNHVQMLTIVLHIYYSVQLHWDSVCLWLQKTVW